MGRHNYREREKQTRKKKEKKKKEKKKKMKKTKKEEEKKKKTLCLQKDNAEVAPAVPAAQVAPAPARKAPCEWKGRTFNANMFQQMLVHQVSMCRVCFMLGGSVFTQTSY